MAWRQALFDMSWRRWQFWLFTGVLSWGFVAVVEELFFRGYCQRRLAKEGATVLRLPESPRADAFRPAVEV